MSPRFWTCQRQANGMPCKAKNSARNRLCVVCGKPRPARKRPAHMKALDLPYEHYVEINGGEHCAICGAVPSGRRLDRDHCHAAGTPRGLLDHRCNRALASWMTPEWLRAAAAYLERSAA